MRKTITVVSAALASMVLLSGPAGAQGTTQTVEVAKVDLQKLPAGYRASKVIGSSVLNDANEAIGKIDDLLVSHRRKGAIRCVIDRWFPRHRYAFDCRPL